MNYKQNEKILQLTDETLIVGVDIAKVQLCLCLRLTGLPIGKFSLLSLHKTNCVFSTLIL